MNDELSLLLAPMGCYIQSAGQKCFQHESQAYVRDPHISSEMVERRRLISMALGRSRLTPDLHSVISSHLLRFDLRAVWTGLTPERRDACVKEVFDRVRLVASGRANGTAVFSPLSIRLAPTGVTA